MDAVARKNAMAERVFESVREITQKYTELHNVVFGNLGREMLDISYQPESLHDDSQHREEVFPLFEWQRS